MATEESLFFDRWPQLLPLYETLKKQLTHTYPDLNIKVSKTQISFYNRRMFAMVSLPTKRKKTWRKEFLMVSFGLNTKKESPRIAMSVEAYPNRWTHHVLVEQESDIDQELLSWIAEADTFALNKQ